MNLDKTYLNFIKKKIIQEALEEYSPWYHWWKSLSSEQKELYKYGEDFFKNLPTSPNQRRWPHEYEKNKEGQFVKVPANYPWGNDPGHIIKETPPLPDIDGKVVMPDGGLKIISPAVLKQLKTPTYKFGQGGWYYEGKNPYYLPKSWEEEWFDNQKKEKLAPYLPKEMSNPIKTVETPKGLYYKTPTGWKDTGLYKVPGTIGKIVKKIPRPGFGGGVGLGLGGIVIPNLIEKGLEYLFPTQSPPTTPPTKDIKP